MSVKLNGATSRLLDVLRGVAALLVVAGHSRDYAAKIFGLNPTGNSLFEKLLLVPSSFAMESVAVFFVLSGFLVGGQVIRDVEKNSFSWPVFLAKRLSRLWVVLIPGLILTWLLWEMVIENNGHFGYDHAPSLFSGVCNAFFLQEARCDVFSNNAALWSLSYEFWFYVVFAAVVYASSQLSKSIRLSLLNLVVAMSVIALFGVHLMAFIPAWLIGAAVAWKFSLTSRLGSVMGKYPYTWVAISVLLISAFAIVSNLTGMNKIALTFFMSIPSALFIMAAIAVNEENRSAKLLIDIGERFGHCSFSIYVYHVPIVIVVLYVLKDSSLEQVNLFLLTYGVVICTVPITLILWWLTERHTWLARKIALKIASRLSPRNGV